MFNYNRESDKAPSLGHELAIGLPAQFLHKWRDLFPFRLCILLCNRSLLLQLLIVIRYVVPLLCWARIAVPLPSSRCWCKLLIWVPPNQLSLTHVWSLCHAIQRYHTIVTHAVRVRAVVVEERWIVEGAHIGAHCRVVPVHVLFGWYAGVLWICLH